MKNIDKIRQMSAEELVKKVLQQSGCIFCAYNDGNCQTKDCNIGQTEWLNQEVNPMPELQVGDIVEVNNGLSYVAISATTLVCRDERKQCNLEDIIKGLLSRIIKIQRYDGEVYQTIWRVENE